MFHFVLLSGGAILIGRSYPPPPRPLSVPLAPPRPLVLYTHPLATTTAAAAAHLLFLYYNVRALSGGSDGSGAEAGLPAECRLERVPGWDCFSNELHSSGLYVSVWGTPPFALAGSFPPCARANLLFFFLLPSSSVPFLRPGPPYSRRARLSMRESFLSMVTRACYVENIVCRDLRQVIIEYLSRLFHPSPLFLSLRLPTFLNIFLALSRAINGEKLFLSIVAFRRYS